MVVDRTQRDDDGFLMSPTEDFSTATYAIASESADLDLEGPDWATTDFLGTVRIRSESERPVFVGIAPEADVAEYLDGVEHPSSRSSAGSPRYSERQGGAPEGPPAEQTFWAASATGAGEQTLEWEPEDGSWNVVVMNADGSRGVAADLSIGGELESVIWIAIGMLWPARCLRRPRPSPSPPASAAVAELPHTIAGRASGGSGLARIGEALSCGAELDDEAAGLETGTLALEASGVWSASWTASSSSTAQALQHLHRLEGPSVEAFPLRTRVLLFGEKHKGWSRMKRLLMAVVVVTAMAVAAPAYAADGFTLYGTATLQGNKVQLVSDFSDTSTANDFGAISFTVPTGATLATLTTLSAEFDVTNDNCGGGSPRFQITIGGKNVFVYLGPAPSFNTCPTGWISSGNLVGTSDQCRVDTSQLIPGTQCSELGSGSGGAWRSAITSDPDRRRWRLVATGQVANRFGRLGDDQRQDVHLAGAAGREGQSGPALQGRAHAAWHCRVQ